MKRFAAILVLMGSIFFAACGGDSEKDEIIQFLIEQDETKEAAECYYKELGDYSLADFEATVDPDQEFDEGFMEDVQAAAEGPCVDL